MRAAVYEKAGAARDVLRLVDIPDPEPGPGEVRVELQWSGINPSDVKARAGLRAPMHGGAFTVPHSDGMGVVDQVGSGVDAARLGERVWLWNGAYERQFGTAARYIALPAAQAVALPEGVAGSDAACLGVPAMTAMHAVLRAGGVRGRTVLVTGAAGAVGHYAVQFAKLLGARLVIGTASSDEKMSIARAAGADVVLNYRTDDVGARVLECTGGEGVDRIIEVDIATNAAHALHSLAMGGQWVVYGSREREFRLPFFPMISRNVEAHFFVVYRLAAQDRRHAIEQLGTLLEQGQVRHHVARRLNLDEIALGHELVERGQVIGNVVLRI